MTYQIDSSVIEASGRVLNATMTELMRLHARLKELEAELAECKEGKIRLRAAIKCERSSGQCMAVHECHRGMCTVENCHFIQNEKLREELAECKLDSDRLNWLQRTANGAVYGRYMEYRVQWADNQSIRGAIDAAMSKGGEE